MKKFVLLLALTLPLMSGVEAQATENTSSCWIGGLSFSKGATVRIGEKTMVCKRDQEWAPTKRTASGCIFEGEFYSEGAELAVKQKSGFILRCVPNGSWRRFK